MLLHVLGTLLPRDEGRGHFQQQDIRVASNGAYDAQQCLQTPHWALHNLKAVCIAQTRVKSD